MQNSKSLKFNKQRLASAFLLFVLVFTSVPPTVFAEETHNTETVISEAPVTESVSQVEQTPEVVADSLVSTDTYQSEMASPLNQYCPNGEPLSYAKFLEARNAGLVSFKLYTAYDSQKKEWFQGSVVQNLEAVHPSHNDAYIVSTNKTGCDIPMSLSVYKMFYPHGQGSLSQQEFFDGTGLINVVDGTFMAVTLPLCSSQVDFWYGLYPTQLENSNPYGGSNPNLVVLDWAFPRAENVCTKTPVINTSHLTINAQVSGSFKVGDAWTLNLTTDPVLANQPVQLCTKDSTGQTTSCTPANQIASHNLPANTDASGNWTGSGTFDSSVVGDWIEYAKVGALGSETVSNDITFTVSPLNNNGGGNSGGYPVCTLPDTSGDSSHESIGYGHNNEVSLQSLLSSKGYSIDVTQDQKEYQTWNLSKASTTIEVEFLGSMTAGADVFGYYINNNPATFVPLLKGNDLVHPSYTGVVKASVGQKYVFSVAASSIQFALKSNFNNVSSSWSSVNSVNSDGLDHMVSYDVNGSSSGSYIIAFEDLPGLVDSDRDFNDVVLRVNIQNCGDIVHVNTPPTISLIGANPITITVGTNFTDPGATANDLEDGNITANIVKTDSVNASTTGTYVLNYSVTDSGGLSASTSRTVIVKDKICTENCGGGGGGNNNLTLSLTANPSNIFVGATTTISWTSNNTTSCAATWTSSTSTSGSIILSPSTTTSYTMSCVGSNNTDVFATTTVVVNPIELNVPSVTLNANPQTITVGDPSTLTWNSVNTTSCNATWTSSTSTSGSIVVNPTSTTEYSISCTGTDGSASATTTITVNPKNNGGGGGGGGGGGSTPGGRRRDISDLLSSGEVLGSTSCSYLKDFLKIGWNNDPVEVLKMQSFLNVFEHENLSLNGVFDQATFDATSRFQVKYFDDILEPWGHDHSTGFVYILTKKKVNEIYCNTVLSLTSAEQDEIRTFRAFLESLGDNPVIPAEGYNIGSETISDNLSDILTGATTTPVIGLSGSTTTGKKYDSVVRNIAASVFALPGKVFSDTNTKCLLAALIWIIIIILLVLLLRRLTKRKKQTVGEMAAPIIMTAKDEVKKEDKKEEGDQKMNIEEKDSVPEILPGEEIIIEDEEEDL